MDPVSYNSSISQPVKAGLLKEKNRLRCDGSGRNISPVSLREANSAD